MQLEFQMKNNPSHVIISRITTFISSRSGRRSVNQRRYCFKSIRGARGRGVGTDNLPQNSNQTQTSRDRKRQAYQLSSHRAISSILKLVRPRERNYTFRSIFRLSAVNSKALEVRNFQQRLNNMFLESICYSALPDLQSPPSHAYGHVSTRRRS
jgi:hypothetical protein